ncbi:hypothetical protein [uncultured Desulfosarcina sp.]|uniref:hypothetical protein n=1 Tax=uncultured Desulfosarcina sp. TaxID=218289 RepID=UPI0029C7FC27|nr:hypothetical protein [uncultured Desulfosarcina sp.]
MIIKEKEAASVGGRIAGDRRTGIDRRVLTYDGYFPERRTIDDRRQNKKSATDIQGEWRDRRRYA